MSSWFLILVVIVAVVYIVCVLVFFFFQAEDGIRDLVRSRGLGDVYKRQERSGWKQCGSYFAYRRFW